jgi:hypothetical protein
MSPYIEHAALGKHSLTAASPGAAEGRCAMIKRFQLLLGRAVDDGATDAARLCV